MRSIIEIGEHGRKLEVDYDVREGDVGFEIRDETNDTCYVALSVLDAQELARWILKETGGSE